MRWEEGSREEEELIRPARNQLLGYSPPHTPRHDSTLRRGPESSLRSAWLPSSSTQVKTQKLVHFNRG